LKYLHLDEGIFCRVRRLAWCNDPESYAGGSVATGRATLAGQVKGEHRDKERYTGPPVWRLGRWASTPSPGGGDTHTYAKKPRQRLGKTEGLYNKRHKARKRLINSGTWNVQGIRGKMEEITSELGKLKMDVIGLTGTKRKGTGSEILGGYVHLYSGVSRDRRAERGVSILIKKKFKK